MAAIEDFNIGKKERKAYDMVWKKKTIILIFFVLISGTIEGPEICDDGLNNGRYAYNALNRYCNLTCDGWAPYCGDGILQSNYGEECDDGNNVSGDGCSSLCRTEAALSPPPSGGRGGYVPRETKVIVKGRAYPNAEITLLKDGRVITTQKANNLANFRIEVKDITPGVWTFSLWAEDKEGRKSITFSFTANVQKDMTTTISGIFLPPTIELSKTKLKKGEKLDISGQTAPQSQVFTHIESPELIKTATSTEEGDWEVEIDTGILDEGSHTTWAKAKTFDGLESSFSSVLAFYVGKEIPELICPGADLNEDGKVNLIDFSIMLYWWGKENPCADQNQDGLVNLPDFSILLYYWTG